MTPTPSQLQAAEEALKNSIGIFTQETVQAIASLLSEREAKAEKRGAEKVVVAVEDSQYPNPNLTEYNGENAVLAARKALSELK